MMGTFRQQGYSDSRSGATAARERSGCDALGPPWRRDSEATRGGSASDIPGVAAIYIGNKVCGYIAGSCDNRDVANGLFGKACNRRGC